jgi:hypothetical protein
LGQLISSSTILRIDLYFADEKWQSKRLKVFLNSKILTIIPLWRSCH